MALGLREASPGASQVSAGSENRYGANDSARGALAGAVNIS